MMVCTEIAKETMEREKMKEGKGRAEERGEKKRKKMKGQPLSASQGRNIRKQGVYNIYIYIY